MLAPVETSGRRSNRNFPQVRWSQAPLRSKALPFPVHFDADGDGSIGSTAQVRREDADCEFVHGPDAYRKKEAPSALLLDDSVECRGGRSQIGLSGPLGIALGKARTTDRRALEVTWQRGPQDCAAPLCHNRCIEMIHAESTNA